MEDLPAGLTEDDLDRSCSILAHIIRVRRKFTNPAQRTAVTGIGLMCWARAKTNVATQYRADPEGTVAESLRLLREHTICVEWMFAMMAKADVDPTRKYLFRQLVPQDELPLLKRALANLPATKAALTSEFDNFLEFVATDTEE